MSDHWNTEASIVSEGVVVGANSKILKSIVGPASYLARRWTSRGVSSSATRRIARACRLNADVPDGATAP